MDDNDRATRPAALPVGLHRRRRRRRDQHNIVPSLGARYGNHAAGTTACDIDQQRIKASARVSMGDQRLAHPAKHEAVALLRESVHRRVDEEHLPVGRQQHQAGLQPVERRLQADIP